MTTVDHPHDDDAHGLETASLCPKSTWDSCEPQRAHAKIDTGRRRKYDLKIQPLGCMPSVQEDPCDGFIELG